MTQQGISKYHARAPRYILSTEDNFLIRIAGPRQLPWEEGTQIVNVSLTGLSFTAPEDLCPLLGEVIKIQFQVPGSQSMACFAVVTRLEQYKGNQMLLGVHFYKLSMPHRIALAQGIAKKFKQQQKEHSYNLNQPNRHLISLLPQIFTMGCFLYLWLALSFLLF